jgi:hypothetical protein
MLSTPQVRNVMRTAKKGVAQPQSPQKTAARGKSQTSRKRPAWRVYATGTGWRRRRSQAATAAE